jgi:hypothetical protein
MFILISFVLYEPDKNVDQAKVDKEQTAEKTTEASSNSQLKELLSKIIVKSDFQDIINGKQKVVVYVENTSDKMFTGVVSVSFKDYGGKLTGSYERLTIDKLGPQATTYRIIMAKYGSVTGDYSISGDFAQVNMDLAQENAAKTEKLKKYMYDGFGSIYKTTWYDSIKEIHVIENKDGCQALIITNLNNDEQSQKAVSAITLAIYGEKYINEIIIKGSTGSIICSKYIEGR